MMGSRNDDLLLTNRLPNIKTKTTAEEETATRTTIWDGEPLSPASQVFLDPSLNSHIICIFGIGTPINNIDTEDLQATLVRHPRFLSIPVFDDKKVLRWRPVELNVKDHIIIPSLSSDPTSPSSNDKLVEDYVSSLSLTTLDCTRPLWEFHIINIPTTECAATAVFRCHHSLGDGMSLISLLLACTRQSDDPTKLPSLPPRRTGPLYALPRPENGILAFLLWIFSYVILLWHSFIDILLLVATILFLRDTKTPLKGHKGVEFVRKRFVHRTIQLDDVKIVKNAMGCTVNDVLVGVTSAALSKFLYRKHCEAKDEKEFPTNTRVRSTFVVNIRTPSGINAIEDMMKEGKNGAKYGNRIGYFILRFPIIIHEDPLEYVLQGKTIATRKKNSLEAVSTYFNIKLILKLFGTKVACALSNKVPMNTTLLFSNLMGPLEQICFSGHPIVYIAPSVYGHAHALTVHFQSYMNMMKVVMAVDDSLISDSHQLLDDFVESLNIIRDAAENLSKTYKFKLMV